MHSECLTGDVFGSLRCDCGPQLDAALAAVAREGRGVVLYIRGHEGRGIGLLHKLQAYQLQDAGSDTLDANLELGLPADARDYGTGAQILVDLGVRSMRLLSNNPAKRAGLEGYGLRVTGRQAAARSTPTRRTCATCETKRDRMGHELDIKTHRGMSGEGAPAITVEGAEELTGRGHRQPVAHRRSWTGCSTGRGGRWPRPVSATSPCCGCPASSSCPWRRRG